MTQHECSRIGCTRLTSEQECDLHAALTREAFSALLGTLRRCDGPTMRGVIEGDLMHAYDRVLTGFEDAREDATAAWNCVKRLNAEAATHAAEPAGCEHEPNYRACPDGEPNKATYTFVCRELGCRDSATDVPRHRHLPAGRWRPPRRRRLKECWLSMETQNPPLGSAEAVAEWLDRRRRKLEGK